MTRILDRYKKRIKGSKTTVSFDTTGGDDDWKFWDRYISIEGKQAYHIGNICGTCRFFFERLDGANQKIRPQESIMTLNEGLQKLDKEVLKTISQIIPNGRYEVILIETTPKLTNPNDQNDYFSNDQKELWEIENFGEEPHNPKVSYYRGTDQRIDTEKKIFEFINPLVPPDLLDPDRINFYKEKIQQGQKPTAIALGVLDIKEPADWPDGLNPKITEHWCLAHYLLDGHHKVFAASELNKPLTLLTFLATDKGTSAKKSIKKLLEEI